MTGSPLPPGNLLTGGIGDSPIDGNWRILGNDDAEGLWLIKIPEYSDGNPAPTYVRGPMRFESSAMLQYLEKGRIVVATFAIPEHWKMDDTDYVAGARSESEQARRKWRLQRRDLAWQMILPITQGRSPIDLAIGHKDLYATITQQATKFDVSVNTIYNHLHRYLAGGAIRNSLLPVTTRCGAPGRHRIQSKVRLGRKLKGPDRDKPEYLTTTLSERSKEQLGFGWALTSKMTREKAYLLTAAAFFSDITVNEVGEKVVELWEEPRRPTRAQFEYWGPIMATGEALHKRIGVRTNRPPSTHRGGSSRDLATGACQVGMLDSTSSDTYLTSIFSRLRVLPPPTRTTVRDVRTSAYLGVHVDWEHESADTALLAILNGAVDPLEKVRIARSFGVESTEDQWPSGLCRTYLVDNAGMRTAAVAKAEEEIGFSVLIAQTYNGPGKGDVESQHHSDHARLDHDLPGTTKGKRRERGEEHPAGRALWNSQEYMGEFYRHMLEFNSEETPDRAPSEMLAEGIRPTRVNIFNWLTEHGQSGAISCDIDLLRAFTLPRWPATLEHNGIFLKTPDGRRLPLARFYADDLRSDPQFSDACRTRHVKDIYVRLDLSRLEQIWFPSGNRMLRLPNVAPDSQHRTLSVTDLVDYLEHESRKPRSARQSADQADLEKILRRAGITDQATQDRQSEIAKLSRAPSKSKQHARMRENAKEEPSMSMPPSASLEVKSAERGPCVDSESASDAAEEAMQRFAIEMP